MMIPVLELASDDFILLHADWLSDQAREAVTRLQPMAVIVQRWLEGPQYFLFRSTIFLEILAKKEGLVEEALASDEVAVPVLDLYDDGETAPLRCVITEENRLIGYCDAGIPPSSMTRGHGESDKMSPTLLVSRTLQTSFPEAVRLGQTTSLLVWLALPEGQPNEIPIAVPIGARIDVIVQPQRGYVLEGGCEGHLIVTDEAETLPLQFRLRAVAEGIGKIRILCFHAGQPLGSLVLAPAVVAVEKEVVAEQAVESRPLAPLSVIQPDLTLMVLEDRQNAAFTMRLTAADPHLKLNFKPFGPIELYEPANYFQKFFQDIENLPLPEIEEQLARKGASLFGNLLPPDLQVLLWSLQDRITSVQIQSDEPWIPWELLKLYGQEGVKIVEGSFFCEKFVMTRWLTGAGRWPWLKLRQIATIAPTDSGLPSTQDELDFLHQAADAHRTVTEIPAFLPDIFAALKEGKYDAWHFAGHGVFARSNGFSTDANQSAILLERGERLYADSISGSVLNCGIPRPLVFLNACQSGREGLSLTGIGGWAPAFIKAGAAAFVGPLWNVHDKTAYKFTQTFYERLFDGKAIGVAAREARMAVRSATNSTWLAYTVFADPWAAIEAGE